MAYNNLRDCLVKGLKGAKPPLTDELDKGGIK